MVGAYSIGDWIGGRFQVFDVHEGGMSLVYVVSDHLGGPGPQVVALKTLRDELLRSRVRISRFAAECRLWVQLGDHPNIVRAHSVEIIDGRPYVVLELIQGGDLIRWIGTSRLGLVQALQFGVQFCLGLEHALQQGLHCHRDVKPGNLLITEAGTLKITDFGLARVSEETLAARAELPDGSIPLAEPTTSQRIIFTDPRDSVSRGQTWAGQSDAEFKASSGSSAATSARGRVPPLEAAPVKCSGSGPSARSSGDYGLLDDRGSPTPTTIDKETSEYSSPTETFDPRLTRTGARLGTGAYMAPEQFRDPRSVDFRADLYGFGVVLFEMITGGLPFKGKSMDLLSRQHSVYKPPSIVPSVPTRHAKVAQRIDEIVQRCLMKDPDARFTSVADLRRALKRVLAQINKR
jgi:serine/threonine protein kinase